MSKAKQIVELALSAQSLSDVVKLQKMLENEIGGRHPRPLGDKWNNVGIISKPGSFDHKALEPVTNMQDAVLERLAVAKYGSLSAVPYKTPIEAARDLCDGADPRRTADQVTVALVESDPPASRSKKLTIIYRDLGCGIAPGDVPRTIFALGADHKKRSTWQQGAFGLGGATTFRNAEAVVLVSRRAPEMKSSEDVITVAVVQWERDGKTVSAYYLTTSEWRRNGDMAVPWSAPATVYPSFEPGTHLALVSYGVEGYHRARLGDERSFDTVLNTRLFAPITPIRFANELVRTGRNEYLRGLAKRLEDNPRSDRLEGQESLPFHIDGHTYHLPIRFYVFSSPGEKGERRNFVARDHALTFTSNGQVHHHWTPQEFRYRTNLNKLYDRILVVVETDELPIEIRTDLFSPDRVDFLATDDSHRLQDTVAAFLNDWNELVDLNGDLIREAITRTSSTDSAIEVARQISRALKVRGFSLGGSSKGGGRGSGRSGGGKRTAPILYPDPTTLEGPEHAVAEVDKTKFVQYSVNAVDSFMPRRGQLEVSCSHPEINGREITVGQLRSGRVRVSIAVPTGAQLGLFDLTAVLEGWQRSSGGLGQTMRWDTEFEVVDEIKRTGTSKKGKKGKKGTGTGGLVAVIWDKTEHQADWNDGTPGHVEEVKASVLAEREEYRELSSLGDAAIPTIVLNQEYGPYKQYVSRRSRDLTQAGLETTKTRYAVGTGLGLLYLEERMKKARGKGGYDETLEGESKQAVARSVLAMMPAFDKLVEEAGVDL